MGKYESRVAYELTKPSHQAIRVEVYQFVLSRGQNGATADEVAAHFEALHNRTSPRMTELRQMFLIRETGVRRRTRQGMQAAVYVATTGESVPLEYCSR
jgi:hypothetical protein